ncbi:proline-rich receptor-like protein kinase PERK9 [Rosa sericea]
MADSKTQPSSHLDFAVNNHFSMLRLDSSSKPHSSAALKRPSPPSSHQPNPKKEKLSPPPLFPGFSKITPLPPLPKSHSGRTRTRNPLLRRCISDPFTPPRLDSLSAPPVPNSIHSPDNDVVPSSAVTAITSPPSVISTRPPPRPTHHRTVSDPTSSPAAKSASRASSSSGDGDDDTPNTKRRLKRIKDRFKEMTLWFEQVMLEDDDDEEKVPEIQQEQEEEEQIINTEPSDDHVQGLENTAVTKEDCDQKRFEESVSVEKVGECIVIHFSCHCGVPYQFLLAGGNCYYKLM